MRRRKRTISCRRRKPCGSLWRDNRSRASGRVGLFWTEGTDDMNTPTAPLHLLAKPTGATCNLDCKYCFFLSKESLYPNERTRMSAETLESYIRQLLAPQD